ncbi:30S ribosomal protein S3 [Candidatus Peribacteria bacterium]|nr:MAG: 30S ribosomal protein S3 [Candidatus Peribacteria bacterium]
MGQKVNPNGFRIGITHTWSSIWFARGKKYRDLFLQDQLIKRHIMTKMKDAGISEIGIERGKRVSVSIQSSKPGILIGKQGAAIEDLKKDLEKRFGGNFEVVIQEIRSPDTDSVTIAENIQAQIQRRMPYRRAAKMAIEKAMQSGALGVKVLVSGRLNGAEIARNEMFKEGNIPLQTLRADIHFSRRHAITKFGTIGIKVWVYKGMVFKNIQQAQSSALPANQ